MKVKAVAMLVLLSALWGGSFLFIRIAAPALGPVVLAALRVTIAGLALLAYAMAIRSRLALRAHAKQFLVLGALNAAIPYTLIASAELHITASLAAILNATTPLFTAVVAAFWLKDRLDAKKSIGLVLGIVGVAILVGWSPLPLTAVIVLSISASLAASLSYGLAGIFSKVAFTGVSPLALALGQQCGASALLLPVALPTAAITAPAMHPSAGVIAAVVGIALLSTSLGYLLYFALIINVGPMKTLSVTYLMPAFGVVWGALVLHERPQAGMLAGLAVILASVTLVTGMRIRFARRRPVPVAIAE